jgi:hypothetical protein
MVPLTSGVKHLFLDCLSIEDIRHYALSKCGVLSGLRESITTPLWKFQCHRYYPTSGVCCLHYFWQITSPLSLSVIFALFWFCHYLISVILLFQCSDLQEPAGRNLDQNLRCAGRGKHTIYLLQIKPNVFYVTVRSVECRTFSGMWTMVLSCTAAVAVTLSTVLQLSEVRYHHTVCVIHI